MDIGNSKNYLGINPIYVTCTTNMNTIQGELPAVSAETNPLVGDLVPYDLFLDAVGHASVKLPRLSNKSIPKLAYYFFGVLF